VSNPYTYHIFCKPTNQHYYGVRLAKNCDPSDLWTLYFTSSSTVKRLIAEHGKDAFVINVRKTFDSKEKALKWEQTVLRRMKVLEREDWINSSIGTTHRCVEPRSNLHRQRISQSLKGKKKSIEQIELLRKLKTGKKASDETRKKMQDSKKNLIWVSSVSLKLSKQISEDMLKTYQDQGWNRGRLYFRNNTRLRGHTDEAKKKMSAKRRGRSNNHLSKVRKGKVLAVCEDGSIINVTQEEFKAASNLVGVASKEGKRRRAEYSTER